MSNTKPRRVGTRSSLPLAWLFGFLLLAGFCFWKGAAGPSTETAPAAITQAPETSYETKAIQDIQEGDIVLARDEDGNALGYKEVVEVYRRTSDHLRILQFVAEDGSTQTLKTTNDHPFWETGKRTFINAGELQVGDRVIGPQGELQTIAATTLELHSEGIPVFNFQVADYHTYFVNEHGARAPPVLVHNADYTPDSYRAPFGQKVMWHYTDQPPSAFSRGFRRHSWVTDNPTAIAH
jgi:hypothetical protein